MASVRISIDLDNKLYSVAGEMHTNKTEIARRCYKKFTKVEDIDLLQYATKRNNTIATHFKFLDNLNVTGKEIEMICWWALSTRKEKKPLPVEVLEEIKKVKKQELELLKKGIKLK